MKQLKKFKNKMFIKLKNKMKNNGNIFKNEDKNEKNGKIVREHTK